MPEEYRALKLPAELIRAIEAHLAELGADSPEEYVEAVLRERLLAEGIISAYRDEESRQVEERLRDLGYLD